MIEWDRSRENCTGSYKSTINVEAWLGRRFSTRSYNCWHFVAEVLAVDCGLNVGPERAPERPTREGLLQAVRRGREAFRRLERPEEPCLVVLWPKAGREGHIGLWTGGRLLHLRPQGVIYEPLDSVLLTYRDPEFYSVANPSDPEPA